MKRKTRAPSRLSDLALAPGDLTIIQALVNTANLQRRTDELTTPRALADWLARQGLATTGLEVSRADFARAIQVRAALRALLAANIRHAGADQNAIEHLDREASRAPMVVRFSGGGATRLEPCSGDFNDVLGRLFAIVAAARLEGLWPRLKACANTGCEAAFWDASRNQSGKWCSTRRCGNRINSRRSQRKKRRDEKRREMEQAARSPARTRDPDSRSSSKPIR